MKVDVAYFIVVSTFSIPNSLQELNIKDTYCIQYKNKYVGMYMKEYIEERTLELAGYIIETKSTVRQAAKKFGISKSTVHKDLTERLMRINPGMAREVREVLNLNKAERHIRGGLATKKIYDSKRTHI